MLSINDLQVSISGARILRGSILCEGTVDEVQNNERVIEVYLGRKHSNN